MSEHVPFEKDIDYMSFQSESFRLLSEIPLSLGHKYPLIVCFLSKREPNKVAQKYSSL